MKLGDSILTYNNEKWTCESIQNQMPVEQQQSLIERNLNLQAENKVLQHKLDLALDMVNLS